MSRRVGARDAFFKESAAAGSTAASGINVSTKQEFGLREREVDKDLEKAVATSALNNVSSNSNNIKSNASSTSLKEDGNYVGYANLPNQVYRKSVKKGFDFTLMVVGESGLGKSTLINSLFLTDIYNSEHPGPSLRVKKTLQVETTRVVLKEGGVQLRLSIVDTPGFGDAVDNTNCWEPVINYIDDRYEEYLNSESRVNRKILPDTRVHCCLYFISPSGHGLKSLDIEFMKRLHDKVNIIPVVAKADTMTPEECKDFKKTILNEIAQNKINLYDFPLGSDEEEKKMLKKLRDRVPFAVVGSNTMIDVQGKKIRGRIYPWGVVEVENLEHNDFPALKNMLIRMHMQDLKDVTNNVHYENFRFNRLASVSSDGAPRSKTSNPNKSPMLQIEEEKKEHIQKMKKMEAEMEQVFEMKVKEKLQKLKDSEADLHRRAEQMKKNLEQQEKEMEEKMRMFEAERDSWEEQNRSLIDEQASKKDKKKTLF